MTEEQLISVFLEEAIIYIEQDSANENIDNGNKFENYVVSVLEQLKKQTKYKDIYIKQTGAQSFPDIIIGSGYGIEVKYTQADKWSSTGNSIFEGTAVKEVNKQIYLLFGMRKDTKIKVRIKNYEDCLEEIKVTHSPRFTINMNIEASDAIFSKLHMHYSDFKHLTSIEKTSVLKEYIKSTLQPGEALWWIDNPEASMAPKVKSFKSLKASEKENLLIESLIHCPDIFSSSPTKYSNVGVYLLTYHNTINSSLRDTFTAGGKKKIKVNGKKNTVPSIIGKLNKYLPQITSYLISDDIDVQRLMDSWNIYFEKPLKHKKLKEPTFRLKLWKELVLKFYIDNEEFDGKIIKEILAL